LPFIYRSNRSTTDQLVRLSFVAVRLPIEPAHLPIVVVPLPFVIDQDRSCPFQDAQIVQVPFKFSSFVRSFVFRSL